MVRQTVDLAKKFLPGIIALLVLAAMYSPYSDRINFFGLQVWQSFEHTWEGSLATVLLLVYQVLILKDSMSKPWWLLVFVLVILFGCFQAWERSYLSLLGREKDLRAANAKLGTAYSDGYQKGKGDQVGIDAKMATPEPPDSLRRRAKKIADDIDEFWRETNASNIPRGNGREDATGEQAEINKRWLAYATQRERACLSRFGTQIVGIPKEMAAKGIPMNYLDKFQAGDNLRCLYPANGAFSWDSETEQLRSLSYRLDARDRLVTF
jgi:hypothetical protein